MKINDTHIAFIGAGNMAAALIEGLLAEGVPCPNIWAADPDIEKLNSLATHHGINTTQNNHEAIVKTDITILAVKPQLVREVLQPLQESLQTKNGLLVSIAAGIPLATLEELTGKDQAIIRCMPNTPALVLTGASALFANSQCSEADKNIAQSILEAVGTVCWLEDEQQMDIVTALSGSGPAYFFLFIEALQEAATSHGLPPELANTLTQQTALGAAKLAMTSEIDISELRRRVTSPGGTTEAALTSLEKDDFKAIIARAISQAKTRSEELAKATKLKNLK